MVLLVENGQINTESNLPFILIMFYLSFCTVLIFSTRTWLALSQNNINDMYYSRRCVLLLYAFALLHPST